MFCMHHLCLHTVDPLFFFLIVSGVAFNVLSEGEENEGQGSMVKGGTVGGISAAVTLSVDRMYAVITTRTPLGRSLQCKYKHLS